jgi:hypothetical protein
LWACLESLLLLLAEKEKAQVVLPEVEVVAPKPEAAVEVEKEARAYLLEQKKPLIHSHLMPKKSIKRHTRMH